MNEVTSYKVLPALQPEALERVRDVEDRMFKLPQEHVFTEHVLHGGLYSRTCMMKPHQMLTGVLMKVPTLVIVAGHCMIHTGMDHITVEGYRVFPAMAGRKQLFASLAHTFITMVYATKAKTVEEAEHEFTDEFHLLASHRDTNHNHVVITGV